MLTALALVHLLTPAPLLANLCPFPVPECHVAVDINCDGKDQLHCGIYDLDGQEYGDCSADGNADDFFLFFDGTYDGVADPCQPGDIVLPQADALVDGSSFNPLCDRDYEEAPQIEGIYFSDGMTLWVVPDGKFDLARGQIGQIAADESGVDLGPVECLADDEVSGGAFIVDEVPPAGEIYFYVARWKDRPFSPGTLYPYGWADCQVRYVLPGNGDCIDP